MEDQKKGNTAMPFSSDIAFKQLIKVKDRIHFFKTLSKQEIAALVYQVRFQKYAPHEVIFRKGESSNKAMFFIIDGAVDIYIHEECVTTLSNQTFFGEIRLFTGRPRSATAIVGNKGGVLLSFWIKEQNEENEPLAFSKLYKNMCFHLSNKILTMNQSEFLRK